MLHPQNDLHKYPTDIQDNETMALEEVAGWSESYTAIPVFAVEKSHPSLYIQLT